MADEIEEPGAPGSETPAQNTDADKDRHALAEEPAAASVYSSTSDPYGEPHGDEARLESAATQVIETETAPAIVAPAPPPQSPPPPPPPGKEDE
jgi:hypothetical protein